VLTFAAAELLTDYRTNQKRSLRMITIRVTKHLMPFFDGRAMAAIDTGLVRQFVAQRQGAGASNATINRDLIALKRMFSLAVQAASLHTRPSIPLLKERNVGAGFSNANNWTALHQQLRSGSVAITGEHLHASVHQSVSDTWTGPSVRRGAGDPYGRLRHPLSAGRHEGAGDDGG
jgi:hypothetical protein